MAKNYNWKIKRKYYDLINSGRKTLEVRVGYSNIKQVQEGNTITFIDYSGTKFEVVRVTRYEDFPDMLDNEDFSKAIPGVTKYEALAMYQAIYPKEKEALGVYVFELRKKTNDMEIFTLSSLMSNHKLFGRFAQAAYSVTDYICKDYPKHFEWYWSKQIPRVFNGSGEVVICTINGNVAGVAFLKRDDTERKICTFLVVEEYRRNHVATKMLNQSFAFLLYKILLIHFIILALSSIYQPSFLYQNLQLILEMCYILKYL